MDLLRIISIFIACTLSIAFDVDILRGRKDPETCCDKLENSSFSTNCQQTLLTATRDEKFAYSPGFPNQFPILKRCSWGIYAKPGKRIRVEFRDFYLIGPGDDNMCDSQGVVIKSPLTGRQMGPHCGNAGLPSVVSPGNYLVIDLLSHIPMTSENFRGFKMSYKESSETPSPELRSENWISDIVLTADPLMVERLFPRVTVESPKRPTMRTTTKSWRFQPPKRPGLQPGPSPPFSKNKGNQAGRPHGRPYPGSNYNQPPMYKPPSPPPKQHSRSLSMEVIVAICVGCVIAMAIVVVVIIKVRQNTMEQKKRRKTKEEKTGNEVATNEPAAGQQPPPQYDEAMVSGQVNPGYVMDANGVPGYYYYYYDENEGKDKAKRHPKIDTRSRKGGRKVLKEGKLKERKQKRPEKAISNGNDSNINAPDKTTKTNDSQKNRKGKRKHHRELDAPSPHYVTKRTSKSSHSEKREKVVHKNSVVDSVEIVPVNTLKMRPPGRDPGRKAVSKEKKRGNKARKASKPSAAVKKRPLRVRQTGHKAKSGKRLNPRENRSHVVTCTEEGK